MPKNSMTFYLFNYSLRVEVKKNQDLQKCEPSIPSSFNIYTTD